MSKTDTRAHIHASLPTFPSSWGREDKFSLETSAQHYFKSLRIASLCVLCMCDIYTERERESCGPLLLTLL